MSSFAQEAEENSSTDPVVPQANAAPRCVPGPRVDLDERFAPVPRQEHLALKRRVEILEEQITGLLIFQGRCDPESYSAKPGDPLPPPKPIELAQAQRQEVLDLATTMAQDVQTHRDPERQARDAREWVWVCKSVELHWEVLRLGALLEESKAIGCKPDVLAFYAESLDKAEFERAGVAKTAKVPEQRINEWLIPDETIDEIWRRCEANPDLICQLFVEFVVPRQDLEWKSGAKQARGSCPVCDDKDRKFFVNTLTTECNCFQCGDSRGNLRTALKRWSGLHFRDLMKDLGERVGIIIEDPKPAKVFDL